MDFFVAYTAVMIIGTFVVLGLILFVERTKLEELEGYFIENVQVRKYQQRWGRNQRFVRFHRMCLMIDILRAPERSVKEGYMTEAELAVIPPALKRWAVWPLSLIHI